MPAEKHNQKLLFKLALSYYEEGLTQKQIGQRFGLSRIKVSRLLHDAREQKIVQISISSVHTSNARMEHEIGCKYGIHEVITVAPVANSQNEINEALGAAAAENLVSRLQGDEVITITWGSTLTAVINCLPVANWPDLRVVQGLGSLSSPEAEVNGTDQARRIAQALGGRPIILSSPGIVPTQAVRDTLLGDPNISKTLSLAANADIALVGIGALTLNSVVLQNNILTDTEIKRLIAKGAAGDIGLRFINRSGEKIVDEIDERIIGLDLPQFKKVKRVIAVGGGDEKVEAIRAALLGKFIHVLITDEQTAIRLLEDNRPVTS